MIGRELDEIVRELYALPPTDFVAARNELVRQARAAGGKDVAERLRQLRRPTRSAWLVNLLARDPTAMQRLSALGRELRDAQTGLARTELRNLAEQRRLLIADLLDRTRAHAAEAGVRLTPTVLSEVEATLQAAPIFIAGTSGAAVVSSLVGFVSSTFGSLRTGIMVVVISAAFVLVLHLVIAAVFRPAPQAATEV